MEEGVPDRRFFADVEGEEEEAWGRGRDEEEGEEEEEWGCEEERGCKVEDEGTPPLEADKEVIKDVIKVKLVLMNPAWPE